MCAPLPRGHDWLMALVNLSTSHSRLHALDMGCKVESSFLLFGTNSSVETSHGQQSIFLSNRVFERLSTTMNLNDACNFVEVKPRVSEASSPCRAKLWSILS